MPYRISKTFEVENGHMLSKHPDACKFPHGHSRKIELVLEADDLDQNEMVCDYKVVKATMKEYLDSFDHAICMNTEDKNYTHFKESFGERVIGFEGVDPTTEIMARTIYDTFKERLAAYADQNERRYNLASGVRIVKVRVWETSSSWSEYFENE